MQTIVLVTGGFDPLHSGHIAYFQAARQLGDRLIVGLNSDPWLTRKKGRPFMPLTERRTIVSGLQVVDEVITYDDDDNSSRAAILAVRKNYPSARIIFANGGDRTSRNIPEMDVDVDNIQFLFGVGGKHKANSSSWILEDWKAPQIRRPWGYYRVLHEVPGVKVKELTVEPGGALSMQRHRNRAEFWLVSSGRATVYTINRSTDLELTGVFERHQYLHIDNYQWHQLINNESSPLKIVEIQYGDSCEEEDIERKTKWAK